LITDVTSVKGPVRALAEKRGLPRFVGGHPMAGKETSGFAAADPRLFEGCVWCSASSRTAPAWRLADAGGIVHGDRGAVVPSTAAEHDRAVAEVSTCHTCWPPR